MNLAAFFYIFQTLWAIPTFLSSRTTLLSNVSLFEVRSLPGSPTLPTSWAGRLPIPERKAGNDIFFWLFKAEDLAYDDNLISTWDSLGN